MTTQIDTAPLSRQIQTRQMLHELGFPVHLIGYKQLCIAIPQYSMNDNQSLTKDLYPYMAKCFRYYSWRAVERAIRNVIQVAWENRNPAVWEDYFPGLRKAPSNKQFIATIAERLK